MKVLYKLTIESLKRNKMMSLFYCIGIFLSVVMLTSMIIFYRSSNNFQQNEFIYSFGEYELGYPSVKDREGLKSILPEENIEEDIRISEFGYVPQEDGTYIQIRSFNKSPEKKMKLFVTGVYPTKENEIMVNLDYLKSHQLQLNDFIQLDILDPVTREMKKNQEFVVVGVFWTFMKDSQDGSYFRSFTDDSGEHPLSDEMMTYNPDDQNQPFITGHLSLMNMDAKRLEKLKKDVSANLLAIDFNSEVVHQKYYPTYDPLSFAYMGIILFFAVVLIHMVSNISIVSFKKKLHDIGMLKSIGATSWQLFACSLIETFIYSIIVIPIALLISVVLMHFVLIYVSSFSSHFSAFSYELILGIGDIASIVLFNVIIILFCNIMPVIKMRKYNVTDLIKDNIEKKKIKYRKYKWTETLFGVEAQLAKRNQRRNKHAVRSVCFSMAISFVLFLCGSYLFDVLLTQLGGTMDPRSAILAGIAILLEVNAFVNLCCVTYSNIILRKKEHQILVSIGLEDQQLKRMLFFENGSVVIKGLLLGVPMGIFLNYILYKLLLEPLNLPFIIQWKTIFVMIILVVLITSILVYVAYQALKKESILTSIKE